MNTAEKIQALLEEVAQIWIDENGYDGYVGGLDSVVVPYGRMVDNTYFSLHKKRFPKAWMGYNLHDPIEAQMLEDDLEMKRFMGGEVTPANDTFTVYVHWDECEDPLYVGKTKRFRTRQGTHRAKAPWWKEIGSITYEVCDSEEEMGRLEVETIKKLKPKYNKAHN